MTAVTSRLQTSTKNARRTVAVAAGTIALMAVGGTGVAQAASCTKPIKRYGADLISTTERQCAIYLHNNGWYVYAKYAGVYYLKRWSRGVFVGPPE